MPWVYLVVAGLFEIGFTTCLKASDGFTKLWPTLGFLASITASMGLLTLAVRVLPLGTAYAVWTAIGAAGTAVVGIVWFNDPFTTARVFFLVTLVGSVIGLKLVSN